uniref:Amino acid transporter transmembrane domain-containing protein n=1 Tax=Chenopodium quinoa TaxID=63459 RepID=A0A803LWG4_CHEQI
MPPEDPMTTKIYPGPVSSSSVPDIKHDDAGAQFVLESKGKWYHAGYHLTTAIVGPTILALPYVFRGLGWGLGFFCLTVMGLVTFYAYYLMSLVLDYCERNGRRHIRFRELAADVLVVSVHNDGDSGVYCTLPAAILSLSQIHQLGFIGSEFGLYRLSATSKKAPPRDYSLDSSKAVSIFNAFNSISIIAAIFGNGILPEIQATLAPPATGKMFKGLLMCYSVIFVTFYAVAFSGYYVFGNKSTSNILKSFLPDSGPALAPDWVLAIAVIFILLQLFAIGLVYSQVAFEIMEKKSADTTQGMFSMRNLIPRIILRTSYMVLCGFLAAMLPFFGDISSVVGAIGFIPLDFILPMLLYNMTHKPSKKSTVYLVNIAIIIIFTGAGLLGAVSSLRKLILDAKQFKLFSNSIVD